ncbi:MAG: helix-turn-helix transcriptional regulator [Bacilli bacterium]|nr:helix-turn-helix transcriptional regulator [Bacilli bacterium]
MTIGERLYKLRKEKNISQEELANELNVSRQTISKWETGESTPDFDKIIPLCEYFNITSDELLSGKENIIESNKEENKKKFARNIAIAVGLYILSIAQIIFTGEMLKKEALSVIIFFIIVALATCLIIYTSIVHTEKEEEKEEENKNLKLVKDIICIIGVIIYFIVSFLTMAWHITWVIFIIVGLCNTIATLVFNLLEKKEDNKNE